MNSTGNELSPSARINWKLNPNNFLWGAIARAVRVPSRAVEEEDFDALTLPGANGVSQLITLIGNKKLSSESLTSYQLGYGAQIEEDVGLDLASFITANNGISTADIIGTDLVTNPAPTHTQTIYQLFVHYWICRIILSSTLFYAMLIAWPTCTLNDTLISISVWGVSLIRIWTCR